MIPWDLGDLQLLLTFTTQLKKHTAPLFNIKILGNVKDMESPLRNLIELLICPWLVAFGHLGEPFGPPGKWPLVT